MIGRNWLGKPAWSLTAKTEDDQSYPILLLEDLQRLFEENDGENLPSSYVVEGLNKMETRPWPEYGHGGKPITATQVNNLLKGGTKKAVCVPIQATRDRHRQSQSATRMDRGRSHRAITGTKPGRPRSPGGPLRA